MRNRSSTTSSSSSKREITSSDRRNSAPSSLKAGIFRSSNFSILRDEEQKLVELLLDLDQGHVFEGWERAGVHDDDKHSMMTQIKRLEKGYPGGIRGYLKNARTLLVDAKAGTNPFDGWRPQVPSGIQLIPNSWSYNWSERLGLAELPHTGFVLVAGGLGERLGYGDIKIGLPVETTSMTTYLEYYCKQIKAMEEKYCTQGKEIPLAIMVSGDTIRGTQIAVRKVAGWFPNITIMIQEKVAALLDNSGKLAMSGPYEIDSKPHGHGDVHSLMHSTGTAKKWIEAGIKWCVFFQDTNALAFHTLPAMLGVSSYRDLEVNSLAIPRFAKQAIGAIAKLTHTDGRSMTVNVEYNQLDPLLRATISPEGDVNDYTGHSPYPGNINQLVFKMDRYCEVLERTQGVLAEFVNPKYADAQKDKFKKPTRLECMMQDYPKVLPSSARVGFTTAPSWLCYSPCKNNAKDAAASAAQGVPAGSAWTAESDQYYCKAEMLREIGVTVAKGADRTFLGITAPLGPKVVIDPSTAIFFSELKQVFPSPGKVKISERSTLVLVGNVVVESLSLDGRLRVTASPGTQIIVRAGRARDRRIFNAGDNLVEINPAFTERLASLPTPKADSPSKSVSIKSSQGSSPTKASKYSEVDIMRGYTLEVTEEEVVGSFKTHHQVDASSASCCGLCPTSCSCGTPRCSTCCTWKDAGEPKRPLQVFVYTGKALVPIESYGCCACDGWADDCKSSFCC